MKITYSALLAILFINLSPFKLSGQTDEKKELFPFIYATYSFIAPGGEFADEYGVCSDIGAGAGIKTKSNWLLSIEATYLFGGNVKQNPLEGLLNSDNQITTMYGEVGQINMRLAGAQAKLNVGKVFPIFGSNNNSGLYIKGSMGFLQHKIFIETAGNNIPQLRGEYVKGYDRLRSGMLISEFIGWQNFDDKGAFHFFAGFEFTQAITENQRSWDFATNQKIEGQRLDFLYALKLGWYIPFRKKQATQFFYY